MTDLPPVLRHICDDLTLEFVGVYSPETVERFVIQCHGQLAETAAFDDYVPLLTRRFARERLHALAHAQGALVKEVPSVLFVCVHNAGRSQMAAALLDRHAQGRVRVYSAGSAPAGEIHSGVIEAMDEVGLDLSSAFPKPLSDEVVQGSDVVITMGCGDACPVYPGKRYLDWELPDPAGRPVEQVRAIRDDIDRRVQALLAELVPA